MSGYPAGVTGREYEISGPDMEWEEDRTCTCGYTGLVYCYESRHERWWQCPEPVLAHAIDPFPVTGKQADGEWGTVGYSCLRCGERVEIGSTGEHPASGGCGVQHEMGPDSEWLAAEKELDAQEDAHRDALEKEADEVERQLEADTYAAWEVGEPAGLARMRLVDELADRRPDVYEILMGRSMAGTYGDARRRA